MRFPSPLRSRDYGNPEDIVAARQAEAANKAKRDLEREANAPVAKRPILTLKRETKTEKVERWSAAREAAEALFDVPIPPRLGRS